MEKKWDTVIPADLKRLFVIGTYVPVGQGRVKSQTVFMPFNSVGFSYFGV